MSITAKELAKLREDHPTSITDATTLSDEQLDDLSRHSIPLLIAYGSYGATAGLFADSRDGRLYVWPNRASWLIRLMKP